MKIKTQKNYITEEASLLGETIAEQRAIASIGGGEFTGANALQSARDAAIKAAEWIARHPEASACARPVRVEARPYNRLAQALLRRGKHITDVNHMVTH